MAKLLVNKNGRLVTSVVALAFVVTACSSKQAPPTPLPVPVVVARVQTRDVPILLTAPGTVEPINSVAVTSMIDGKLLSAKVRNGDDVAANQLLFTIDPRPAQATVQQTQAALARDQAALDQAQSEVTRNAPVAAKGYISAEQMEQYRTAVEAAAASIKVDKANVAAAEVALSFTEIRAPQAGRIGRILIQPGNLIKANDSNALVVINQIEPIYVSFALPGSELGRVMTAQKDVALAVTATSSGVTAPVAGELAFVDNAIDSSTGTIELRAQFSNSQRVLWPGQLVNVSLTLGHDVSALVVPDQAIQNGPDGSYVFVIAADEHAEQRAVTVTRVVAGEAVIGKGLAAGETVVIDGQSRVENGAVVKVSDAAR